MISFLRPARAPPRPGGEQDDVVGVVGVADEVLGAVDDEVAAALHGRGLHAAQVRAGARLGHRQALDALAAHGRAAGSARAARPRRRAGCWRAAPRRRNAARNWCGRAPSRRAPSSPRPGRRRRPRSACWPRTAPPRSRLALRLRCSSSRSTPVCSTSCSCGKSSLRTKSRVVLTISCCSSVSAEVHRCPPSAQARAPRLSRARAARAPLPPSVQQLELQAQLRDLALRGPVAAARDRARGEAVDEGDHGAQHLVAHVLAGQRAQSRQPRARQRANRRRYSRCTQALMRFRRRSADTCPQKAIQNAHSV